MVGEVAAAFMALVTAMQPVGTTVCDGVRPGTRIMIDAKGPCTTNFLFEGSDGARYIGTAGHCLLESTGTIEFADGAGPEVVGPDGDRVGEGAYASLGQSQDFGLIEIDDVVEADAEMCHFGGPIGMFRGESPDPVVLHHYGHGTVVGYAAEAGANTVPARTAIAPRIVDRDSVGAIGIAAPGDSGSPVIDDRGRAVGVLTELGGETLPHPVGIRRIGFALLRAEAVLGIDLRLMTAPY